jgi:8-oxo-dGTP pyrophosphatase MutT (NUDIX family)
VTFNSALSGLVASYLQGPAEENEHLSLLRWQISQGHALDQRSTLPGHVTTSAFVITPDLRQVLMINHLVVKRWLQPGGHYEATGTLRDSAAREVREETGLQHFALHDWHNATDAPLVIDSHDVPGRPERGEQAHVHHDFQYLFIADADQRLSAQFDEVSAAAWHPIDALSEVSPRGLRRIRALGN